MFRFKKTLYKIIQFLKYEKKSSQKRLTGSAQHPAWDVRHVVRANQMDGPVILSEGPICQAQWSHKRKLGASRGCPVHSKKSAFGIWTSVISLLSDFWKFQNLALLCLEKLWHKIYIKIYTGRGYAKKSH
jgi:hypothetical protein